MPATGPHLPRLELWLGAPHTTVPSMDAATRTTQRLVLHEDSALPVRHSPPAPLGTHKPNRGPVQIPEEGGGDETETQKQREGSRAVSALWKVWTQQARA